MLTVTSESILLKAKLFNGLADPSRLSILEALRGGPLSVGEIVRQTGLSQPNVSNHLSCLHDCGLVARRQEGRDLGRRHAAGAPGARVPNRRHCADTVTQAACPNRP